MNKISIEAEYCKGCGLCIFYCPRDVLQASSTPNSKGYPVVEVKAADQCIGCRSCEINCPDFAIEVTP